MNKIGIITSAFYPSTGAGCRRITYLIKYLLKKNIKVYLFTTNADYLYSFNQNDQEIPQILDHKNLMIYRFPGFLFNENFNFKYHPKRIFNKFIRKYIFWDTKLDWGMYAHEKINRLIKENNIKTIFSSAPCFSSHYISYKIKKENKNLFWVMDMRDPWVDNEYFKFNIWQKKIIKKYEKLFFNTADEITVISKYLKEKYKNKYNIKSIHTIYNGFDSYKNNNKVSSKENKFLICYTGTLYEERKSALLKFIEELSNIISKNIFEFDIKFIYAGKLDNITKNKINDKLGDKFKYLGFVSLEKSIHLQNKANMLLLPIGKEWEMTSKVFEYMKTHNPIYCIMKEYNKELVDIINNTKTGKCFLYDEKENLKNFLVNIDDINKNINTEKIKKYDYENLTDQLLNIIDNGQKN
ncbi:MAG: glycosyltransferase [archaeon]